MSLKYKLSQFSVFLLNASHCQVFHSMFAFFATTHMLDDFSLCLFICNLHSHLRRIESYWFIVMFIFQTARTYLYIVGDVKENMDTFSFCIQRYLYFTSRLSSLVSTPTLPFNLAISQRTKPWPLLSPKSCYSRWGRTIAPQRVMSYFLITSSCLALTVAWLRSTCLLRAAFFSCCTWRLSISLWTSVLLV